MKLILMIACLVLVIITERVRIESEDSSVGVLLGLWDRDVKEILMNVCRILVRLLARRIVFNL